MLGTTYGGNGTTNFALPELRGRTPLHFGALPLGQRAGAENHTLVAAEMPAHTHPVNASAAAATAVGPAGAVWAQPPGLAVYAPSGGGTMAAAALTSAGSSQPHSNVQPFLALNFCIALQGIFPSPS
ncbi:MAG TPA: phage tail protein [Solibacterales bacterium]|nr:phage tail protein [Bryobacterales bacterium]